jgi:formylglycine-generating enzyme required for sulfatase activity
MGLPEITMYDIFISHYAPTDSPWVNQLYLRLKQSGTDVWVDAVRIRHGEPRTEAIWAGMMTSRVMVLVVTPEAMEDSTVTWQWTHFLNSGKPVLPVILHEARLPAPLRRRHYVDFFNQGFETAFQQLCDKLSLLGIILPAPQTLLPAQVSIQEPGPSGHLLRPKSEEVRVGVRAILPSPFTWIEIPSGRVTLIPSEHDREHSYLKRKTTFRVTPFAIAKYPITNAQYALFVEAGGYDEQRWWTTAGWESRIKRNRKEPGYWHNPKFNASGQPVVGVSWYEAVAFCRWLSAMSGETVMLPTEQQWQWAAQGKRGWLYPWGNGWNGTRWRCNNTVPPQRSEGTTWVRQYEGLGDSPFGVVDMAGNVEEWCLTGYYTGSASLEGTEQRMARGGCWRDEWPENLQTTVRNPGGLHPEGESDFIGFRCVRLG